MWKTLRHPNVLPLIGVMMSENQFVMVSEWMMNGNINDFVRTRPDVNRIRLVGFCTRSLYPCSADNCETFQLEGVVNGLIYIHSQGMIHGDLKGVGL